MARRQREVLAKLDPLAVARYQIIEKDDLELFLESELGVYILEEERIEAAQAILDRMKGDIA